MKKSLLLCFLLLVVVSCDGPKPEHGRYSIGRDQSWFPVSVGAHGPDLVAFTNELVQTIAKIEDVPMHVIDVSWPELFLGLDKGEYAGIFTSIDPTIQARSLYAFSDPFFKLGPVLVVPIGSDVTSLSEMHGKLIGIDQFGNGALIVQDYPSLLIKTYQNMPTALDDLVAGDVDAVLLPNLQAQILLPTQYSQTLKVVSKPLDEKALRIATLKGRNGSLIRHFNNGLRTVKKSSEYTSLQEEFYLKP